MRALIVVASGILLSACAKSPEIGPVMPASVAKGECEVFPEPVGKDGRGFHPEGANVPTRRWIAGVVESGVSSCGWDRPPPRQRATASAQPEYRRGARNAPAPYR